MAADANSCLCVCAAMVMRHMAKAQQVPPGVSALGSSFLWCSILIYYRVYVLKELKVLAAVKKRDNVAGNSYDPFDSSAASACSTTWYGLLLYEGRQTNLLLETVRV